MAERELSAAQAQISALQVEVDRLRSSDVSELERAWGDELQRIHDSTSREKSQLQNTVRDRARERVRVCLSIREGVLCV